MIDQKSYFQLGTWYSMTLNPPNVYQYLGKTNRVERFYEFVSKQLLQIGCQYDLFIEISEPHAFHAQGEFTGPRLHLHGIIKFITKRELRNFLFTGYYSLTRWTSTDIDTIADMTIWKKYISKQKVIPRSYRRIRTYQTSLASPSSPLSDPLSPIVHSDRNGGD